MSETRMSIMRGDAKMEGCHVPIFQLLQFKHAIKLESLGMRHSSGRSVAAHAKRALKLPRNMRRENVIARIEEILSGTRAS